MAEGMKRAIQRIMRDDAGNLAYTLVDLDTLQPVTDPTGYKIVNQYSSHVEEITDVKQPDAPKSEKAVARQIQTDTAHNKVDPMRGGSSPGYTTSARGAPSASSAQAISHVAANRPSPSSPVAGRTRMGSVSVAGETPTTTAQRAIAFAKQPSDDPAGLGRTSLAKADLSGLHPDMRAKVEAFRDEAQKKGLDLSIDTANMVRTPAQQQALFDKGPKVTKTKNSYHMTGMAVDISPTNVKDQKAWAASRELAKESGFGLLGSWDPAHMQAQVPGETAKSLASKQKDTKGFAQLSPEQSISVRGNAVPAPYGRQELAPAVNDRVMAKTKEITKGPLSAKPDNVAGLASFAPTATTPAQGAISQNFDKPSVAQSVVSAAKTPTSMKPQGDISKYTPAQATFHGLTPMTDKEKALVSKALSGELSAKTREAALAGDPMARAHVGSLISSITNRAQSKMYSSITEAVTAPSQYSAFNPGMISTTEANYKAVAPQTDVLVDAFTKGDVSMTPKDWGVTSYFNPAKASPPWGPDMKNSTDLLDHRFGQLPEYSPSKSFATKMSGIANSYRDYSGTSYAPGQYNSTPSTNRDAPSERGSRFGGSGLGGNATADRSGHGSFGTSASPGVGRSSQGVAGGGTSQRSGHGSFGSSASPGVGRSSYGGGGGSSKGSTSSGSYGTSKGSSASSAGYGGAAGGSKSSGSYGTSKGSSASSAGYGGAAGGKSSGKSSDKGSSGGGSKSAGSGGGYSGGRNTA